MRQSGFPVLLFAGAMVVSVSAIPAFGQAPAAVPAPRLPKVVPAAPPVVPVTQSDARQVRFELIQIFQKYPPSLRRVFQLDPSLIQDTTYLATYPELGTYFTRHPEIGHNPSFFLESPDSYDNRDTLGSKLGDMTEPLAVASVFIVFIGTVGWMVRGIMNHRRWLRISKLQTDLQNKLLERFTSNEEMLSFIQTPAGQRFMESASVPAEAGPRSVSAPIARILWSIQLGIVLVVAGGGLEVICTQISQRGDFLTLLAVTGALVIAVGLGFMLSSLGSYILSRRLGLLDIPPTSTT